jgi:hypothetical protein
MPWLLAQSRTVVQADLRHDEAHALGAQDAHVRRAGGLHDLGAQPRAALLVQAGVARPHEHHGVRAALPQVADDLRGLQERAADHGQVRGLGQVGHGGVGQHPGDGLGLEAHGHHRTGEAAAHEVLHDQVSDVARFIGRADDRHGFGAEEKFEIGQAHAAPALRALGGGKSVRIWFFVPDSPKGARVATVLGACGRKGQPGRRGKGARAALRPRSLGYMLWPYPRSRP